MFLAIDVGNTQTTLGLINAQAQLLHQWRMASNHTDTSDQLHETLFGYFQMSGLSLDCVSEVAIASVVPILSQEWVRMLRRVLETEPLVVDATRDCGIAVNMPDPRQVGADRLANALAARTSYGAPVIVVDFGTATNIDVVDAEGAFRGGAIMPGLMLSAQSLFARAAKLSSVPLEVPPHALGNSTETAVQSGIVIGAATQAEGLVERIIAELAEENPEAPRPTVVATGGLARTIAGATTVFDHVDKDLTIRGIYQIWSHRNEKKDKRGELA